MTMSTYSTMHQVYVHISVCVCLLIFLYLKESSFYGQGKTLGSTLKEAEIMHAVPHLLLRSIIERL